MSTGLFSWFRRKPKELLTLSKDERDYRQWRIDTFSSVSDRPLEEIERLMDSWVIDEAIQGVGNDPATKVYIPHPIWDDEYPFTRRAYGTYELACAEVKAVNGVMFDDLKDCE
ncbi:hypothetical protein QEH42_gp073 [Microbacterium phage Pumpernickel]|uniref:Uncharacterized protein n=1 Tax=Microbacterium phage Pumpernickel TaxID=2885983 RepID=A0AAE8Y720_9CAUD|nr:hypothetical protein QEH42_gp073 [Microbacterium phage Pumpernickel]UDL15864.1 hypothetical protein SEA_PUMPERNICKEL_73 [Microbacterium phage Pumpernickel]